MQTGVLGEGTFGVVVRARDPASEFPEQELAIKMLPRGEFVQNFRTYIKREIVHQQSLQHPFIVSLTEVRCVIPSHSWEQGVLLMRSLQYTARLESAPDLGAMHSATNPAETLCVGGCGQVFLTVTHLCIVMEYAAGGDMFKYICSHRPHCRLLESQARWIFQQLITGLDYCHLKVTGPLAAPATYRQLGYYGLISCGQYSVQPDRLQHQHGCCVLLT